MALPGRVVIDWSRVRKWCLLGSLGMVIWLLVPVVRCSIRMIDDTSIGEVEKQTAGPEDTDIERVEEGTGFFSRAGSAIAACYRKTPLFGQEPWKRYVLIGLLAITVVAWVAYRIEVRRRGGYA